MAQFYSVKQRDTMRQVITVTVNDLDPFGQGVARHKGKTFFIRGALPDEKVDITITEDKRNYALAVVKHRYNDSPERVVPRCPHFGICGGCQQQHASVALQQEAKSRALARLMGNREQPRKVDEIIAAQPWGYRRRARLGLNYQARSRTLQMGFRKASAGELVDVHRCPILAPRLEALLNPLHQCLSGLTVVRRLGHVELVLADNGPLMVLRHLAPLSAADRQTLTQFSHANGVALYLAPDSDSLVTQEHDAPWYQSDGLRLSFSPRDFIQVNDEVNQRMVSRAMEWLDVQPQDRVLDLFCGMGNFTLPLAKRAAEVVGVEGVAALVEKGEYNARYNSLKNVTFFHENLEEDVMRQPWAAQGFNKILLDPARAGASGVMQHIIRLAPDRVVYVSCNPTTLARDSALLLTAGYRVGRLAMLDMFPHTGHLESMALFVRG